MQQREQVISKKRLSFILICSFSILLFLYSNFKILKTFKLSELNLEENPKLVCMILTAEKNIAVRGPAVWDTWAKYCTTTVFTCNCPNLAILQKNSNAVVNTTCNLFDAIHLPIMQLNVTEDYWKMDEKVMTVIRQVYALYGSTHHWFYMTDDDTFVFTDNLYKFIKERKTSEPLAFGYNFKVIVKSGYIAGGSGILFTNESMNRLTDKIKKNECNFKDGWGDVAIGHCMEKANVTMGVSIDAKGRERFHCQPFHVHYKGPLPGWLFDYAVNSPKTGKECCSNETISFHYVNPNEMRIYKKTFNFSLFD